MNIIQLLSRIRATPGCVAYPSQGIPAVASPHRLPDDVREFYEICGGVKLYIGSQFRVTLVGPADFRLANPVLVGQVVPDDISSSWYIVATGPGGPTSDAITIDCDLSRLGRCYDSFWDRHGVAGSCPIVALSFTDLVERLLNAGGTSLFWQQPGFVSIGDAYDSSNAVCKG